MRILQKREEALNATIRMAALAAALVCLSGCAATRSTIMPDIPTVANPETGTAVRLGTIEDLRVFERDPPQASMPSLGSDADLHNPSVTAHAIGRKRGGFGQAMGDVMLPKEQTVATVIGTSVTNAFRRAGFRVLQQSDPGYGEAAVVDVKIKQFWSYFRPGFVEVAAESIIETDLKAPLKGLQDGLNVTSKARVSGGAIFESDWRSVNTQGLADYELKLVNEILVRQK